MKYWLDEKTGLYWELKTFGNRKMEYSVAEAIEYADELNSDKHGGFDDWRLPSLSELSSIASVELYPYSGDYKEWRAWYESIRQNSNNGFFVAPQLSDNMGKDGWYWSATQKNDTENYLVNFKEANTNHHVKTQSFYVRCVRG